MHTFPHLADNKKKDSLVCDKVNTGVQDSTLKLFIKSGKYNSFRGKHIKITQ